MLSLGFLLALVVHPLASGITIVTPRNLQMLASFHNILASSSKTVHIGKHVERL